MRNWHAEKRLSPTQPPPLSAALERDIESLLAKVDALRKQCNAQVVGGEAIAAPTRSQSGAAVSGETRPRHFVVFAAIVILLAGALLLAVKFAWADGGIGRDFHAPALDLRGAGVAPPALSPQPVVRRARGEARATGLAVCVRLCDGYFFPSAAGASGGDDACAAQCPDAPTARYTERAGSDRIDDAVSTRGASYSALPAAFRYRTALDNACTCHRSPASAFSAASLSDPTLRKGDAIMTPKGLLVFQGAKSRSATRSDFVAAAQATALPKALREALLTLQGPLPSQVRGELSANWPSRD
ncbi:MAG TPA: DUF2865 domain-containing protein [Roseiarcus sp.]|jgi:hypothetical protein